jgi:hypothetical protein
LPLCGNRKGGKFLRSKSLPRAEDGPKFSGNPENLLWAGRNGRPFLLALGRARGWSEPFGFLLAHASWIAAESPQQSAKRFARTWSGKPGRRSGGDAPKFFSQNSSRIHGKDTAASRAGARSAPRFFRRNADSQEASLDSLFSMSRSTYQGIIPLRYLSALFPTITKKSYKIWFHTS